MSGSDALGPLPDLPHPSAGASAADHHRRLLGEEAGDPGRDVPLADLLGPLRPVESAAAANWRRGAQGERLTAQLLAPLGQVGWRILHDRRLPGSHANVDHLVIGPTGVWVVDSKVYRGRIKILGDGRLWYGRRCLDEVLRVVRWQADEIARLLEVPGTGCGGVRPTLCVHNARLPRSALRFDGVTLTSADNLLEVLISGTRWLTAENVDHLSTRAGERLAAAQGRG